MRAVAVLAASLLLVAAVSEPEVVRATVGGVVVETVRTGDAVEEGAPLVWVRTATKPREVAARAPRSSTVVEVLVQVGARIRVGDPVVRLGP
ncbi:MAG: biotin/lipoyl-containing protein [bacterium]